MTAREYFEAASAAQRNIDACLRRIAEAEARTAARSRSIAVAGGGAPADPMRAVDAAMDEAAAARAELAECGAAVAEAREVCRGVRRANPRHPLWGDCIELHFIDLMTWRQVGSALGVTGEAARKAAATALDWVDMVGIARARAGA